MTTENILRDYKRLLRYLRPYMGSFILAAIGMAVVSTTAGGAAFLIQPLMDEVFIKKDRNLLMLLPAAIVVIYLLRGVGRYYSSMIMQKIGQMTVRDIRNDLYSHMQQLSLSFHHRHTTGKLVSRIVNDVNVIQDTISIAVYDLFRESFTAIALLAVLVYRDPKLSLFALITFPFAALLIGKLGRKLRAISRNTRERIEAAANAAYAHDFIMEMPMGYDTVIGKQGTHDGLLNAGGAYKRVHDMQFSSTIAK